MIREFRPSDEERIAEIGSKVWKPPYWEDTSFEEEEEELEKNEERDSIILVAEIDKVVEGFAMLYPMNQRDSPYPDSENFWKPLKGFEVAYLDELAISPNHQHEHLGSKLLKNMTEKAEKYDKMVLRTNPNSEQAYKFYKSHGFEDLNVSDPEHPERTYMVKNIS